MPELAHITRKDAARFNPAEEDPKTVPYPLSKGPFYAWSKNGIKPTTLLQTLHEHYTNLAASYLQQRMAGEAEVFSDLASELQSLEQELAAFLAEQAADQDEERGIPSSGVA